MKPKKKAAVKVTGPRELEFLTDLFCDQWFTHICGHPQVTALEIELADKAYAAMRKFYLRVS